MLIKSLKALSGAALISALGAVFSAPSHAANIQFSCEWRGSLPTTVARNMSTGRSISVIHWYSHYFSGSGYTPERRCNEVSERFQRSYNDGSLNYVTVGIVNNEPVVCAASPGSTCDSTNLLFTLKRGTDAAKVVQQLFDVRAGSAPGLYQSAHNRPYINVQAKLSPIMGETASSEPEKTISDPMNNSESSETITNTGNNTQPTNNSSGGAW